MFEIYQNIVRVVEEQSKLVENLKQILKLNVAYKCYEQVKGNGYLI